MNPRCEWTVAPDYRYEEVGMRKQRGTRVRLGHSSRGVGVRANRVGGMRKQDDETQTDVSYFGPNKENITR